MFCVRLCSHYLLDRVKVAFVHGSFTKDSMKADSDVDIIVIGSCRFAEVVNAISHAQDKLCLEVNPSVYPEAEFKEKIAKKLHFLTTILKEPRIFSIGDGNELARQIVSKWRKRFFEHRLEGIEDRSRTGRPSGFRP